MSRRSFLAATGLAPLVPTAATAAATPAATAAVQRRPGDPFELGVASGDPAPDGFVLWTRLAPRPLAEDGYGGLPSGRGTGVEWQIAEDQRFQRVVRTGRTTARYADAGSVHVEVTGLRPGREYFYRFRAGGHLSPTGRTLTAPPPGALTPVTFAAVSCAYYEHGYFTAYRRMAEQHPDLVVHLGDYLYEGSAKGAQPLPIVRRHVGGTCRTLADFRLRHAQYKADPDLRAAHAAAPWAVVWDDHELENNWAGETPGKQTAGYASRKQAAFRAYYENMPLRRSVFRSSRRLRLTRRLQWGGLATFHLLDTRQFRSDQPCEDGVRTGCDARLDRRRTLLGPGQLEWLDAGLRASGARWNVLAQQIFLAQRDHRLGPGLEVALDGWDGYAAERRRLMDSLLASRAGDPVVLTGDVHVAHANELRADPADPDSARVGVELVATSIASDGDGYHDPVTNAAIRAENQHIAYIDQRRGYVLCKAGPAELRADFHTVPYVTRRNAPSSVSATFTVPAGARSFGNA